jgi:queuine tRNA-ribosyltransferase
MHFALHATDPHSSARAGVLETTRGLIETPIFMPVGTVGTVKAVDANKLRDDIKAQIILGNTYHLYLRPGLEVLRAAGGLHGFAGWHRPILTDSGGYQVFSLAENRKIKEEGVTFRSHIDGSKHTFTPERSMEIQRVIGADIIMAFDECPPGKSEEKYAANSMHLTHRWLDRCIAYLNQTEPLYGQEQSLFPIVQGATYRHLRTESCAYIAGKNAIGNAIGGLSVGEPAETMYEITELCCQLLPKDKPRYLMGVGTPDNILTCISLGVDMFDCVMPTRNGRNGYLFTTEGVFNIKNKKWELDFSPIDPGLPNVFESQHSKAYVRHLFQAEELLGLQIASVQNLAFYLWLVGQAREKIMDGTFEAWRKAITPRLMQRM